jgi:hypothetical protein
MSFVGVEGHIKGLPNGLAFGASFRISVPPREASPGTCRRISFFSASKIECHADKFG